MESKVGLAGSLVGAPVLHSLQPYSHLRRRALRLLLLLYFLAAAAASTLTTASNPTSPAPLCRWVDEYGHVVGDTHEPEAGAAAPSRKRAASEGGGGGGKRHRRSVNELLGSGGGSSGSDLQSLPSAAAAEPPAAEPAPAPAPPALPAQEAGLGAPPSLPGVGVLGKTVSPDKLLDTYTAFNLAASGPGAGASSWALPLPAAAGAATLEIPGLRINAKPSSLLPPPTQAGPLPEALPLDTTSPLATAAAAHALGPFSFNPGAAPHLDGLTLQHQQVCATLAWALSSCCWPWVAVRPQLWCTG